MIRYKDTILEDYFIDPITAIITNSKGEIQEVKINKNGRPYFKRHCIHQWQVHTHIGYKEGYDIHHLDENKLNNALSNLAYLSRSEHTKIHNETREFSEETKNKMSESNSGEKNPMYGKHHSSEAKRKIGEAKKWSIWINNGVISKRVQFDEDIPEGFVRGRLKTIKLD